MPVYSWLRSLQQVYDSRGHLQPSHPDVGPVRGRNPLGLRFVRRVRLADLLRPDGIISLSRRENRSPRFDCWNWNNYDSRPSCVRCQRTRRSHAWCGSFSQRGSYIHLSKPHHRLVRRRSSNGNNPEPTRTHSRSYRPNRSHLVGDFLPR